MEFSNIRILRVVFYVLGLTLLIACKSSENNISYPIIDETYNEGFKIKESDIDIYLPHVQVINYETPDGLRENIINRFNSRFNTYFVSNQFYYIPDFLDRTEIGDKIIDSLENTKSKLIPNQLKKYLNKNKKYSLVSCYKGYHLKKYSQLNIFIIDNKTFEKVYSNYNARLINFDDPQRTDEFCKEVFKRFLE